MEIRDTQAAFPDFSSPKISQLPVGQPEHGQVGESRFHFHLYRVRSLCPDTSILARGWQSGVPRLFSRWGACFFMTPAHILHPLVPVSGGPGGERPKPRRKQALVVLYYFGGGRVNRQ